MIVGIGACVQDTLINLSDYPTEDTKTRALSTKLAGGGPTATGLCATAHLGAEAQYIGVLSDDTVGNFLLEDFSRYGVNTGLVTLIKGYRAFTSVIWLSEKNASRTCVFDKGTLPPLKLNDSQREAVKNADILMIDGNEMASAVEACEIARGNNTTVLYDCGGLYDGVENLLRLTDIMIPSEEFAKKHTGEASAEAAAKKLMEMYKPKIVVVTCGKEGGVYYDGVEVWHYPAFTVNAVDTNGSGDVFHGAFAYGISQNFDYKKCCVFSSAVSALKCTGIGARESVPDFNSVKKFLEENNYEL